MSRRLTLDASTPALVTGVVERRGTFPAAMGGAACRRLDRCLEVRGRLADCVGAVQQPAQEARQASAFARCVGGGDGVVDAQVTARVHGGETPFETEPATR